MLKKGILEQVCFWGALALALTAESWVNVLCRLF